MQLTEAQISKLTSMRARASEIDKAEGNPALYWAQHLSKAVDLTLTSFEGPIVTLTELAWLKAINDEYNATQTPVRKSEEL